MLFNGTDWVHFQFFASAHYFYENTKNNYFDFFIFVKII